MSSKSPPRAISPSSDNIDEKKLKRKASNRESARKSRLRKQQRVEELVTQDYQMKEENKKLRLKIDELTQQHINVASDNNVLRARMAELTDRLQSLNSVLQIASERNRWAFDSTGNLDTQLVEPWQLETLMEPLQQETLMEPWQLPYSMHSIPANADMFHY